MSKTIEIPSTNLLSQCSTLVGNEIRFTYNSHKEAFEALEKARAEHAALIEVEKSAQAFIKAAGSLPFMNYSGTHYEEWKAAKDAIANLEIVRKGGAK